VEASRSRWRISRKDGKSVLLNGIVKKGITTAIVGDDEYKEALMAAKNCPVKIIKVNKQ